MDGSRGQHAGDWDLAAGDIQMQFVADPGFRPGLIEAVARRLIADFAQNLERQLAGGGAPAPAAATARLALLALL